MPQIGISTRVNPCPTGAVGKKIKNGNKASRCPKSQPKTAAQMEQIALQLNNKHCFYELIKPI
jgi:hypothetical protein